jgi:hypothetical protein
MRLRRGVRCDSHVQAFGSLRSKRMASRLQYRYPTHSILHRRLNERCLSGLRISQSWIDKTALNKPRMTYPSTVVSQRSFFGSGISLNFISSIKSNTTTSGVVLGARISASKDLSGQPVVGTCALPLFLAILQLLSKRNQNTRMVYGMSEMRMRKQRGR